MSFLMRNESIPRDEHGSEESIKSIGPDEVQPKDSGHGHQTPLHAASSSVIKFYPNWCTCFDHKINYTRPEHATCKENCKYFFRCPPGGPVAKILVFLIVFALTWTVLWLLVGDVAGFRGPIMAIFVLEIFGLFLGLLIKVIGFPALLAPLALGIMLRNIDALDIFKNFQYPYQTERHMEIKGKMTHLSYCTAVLGYNISNTVEYNKCCNHWKLIASSNWITPIREIALTLILTRAGLELSPKQLKKLKGVVPALAFGPCCVEALTCAALFYGFFNELSPSVFMCFVAGFALSAVSPAVVVPGILSLSRKGYGIDKGIPTLLIAASSIDDVLAITLYTIFLSLATAGSPSNLNACKNPFVEDEVEPHYRGYERIIGSLSAIVVGLVFGVVMGCILHFLPSRESGSKGITRLVVLLVVNICCMLGFERTVIVSGAGSIGVLTTSFIASFGWRSQRHWKPVMHEVEHKLGHIWAIAVPILFGTIGKEIKFSLNKAEDPYDVAPTSDQEKYLKDKYWDPLAVGNIFRIIGIILICLLVRSVTTFFIAWFAKLSWRERLFVSLAWMPKATVQAALAPLVLSEIVDKAHTVQMTCLAKAIVAMAVFSIIITAPIGALCITFTGPRLLTKTNPTDIEEEFPDGEAASIASDDSIFKASQSRLQSISTTDPESTFYSADDMNGSMTSLPRDERGSSTAVKTLNSPLGTGGSMTVIKPGPDGNPGKPRLNRGSTGSTPDNPNSLLDSDKIKNPDNKPPS